MKAAVRDKLEALGVGRVLFDEPLARHTTYGLGGPAAALVEPDSPEALTRLLAWLTRSGAKWFVLGGGSNILALDQGFDGAAVRLGEHFQGVKEISRDRATVRLAVGAATTTGHLVHYCRKAGFGGLECLAGVPGWVGGALAMNAGTHLGDVSGAVARILLALPGEGEVWIHRGALDFHYRGLTLPAGAVILEGEFDLTVSDPETVSRTIAQSIEKRKKGQPKGVKSAGCVFRNPEGDAAGRLIDQAGLKGRRIGGAWVSETHANFIVHQGDARAADVTALMKEVRETVFARFGVQLTPEVTVIGAD